ncbi:MAG: putative ABC transport system permease protein, partial [Luteibaculaceae bacterium]
MKIFRRLLKESIIFAFQALFANRLRSFLSLLGITIGIFSIISVFTLVDTMENGIRKEIDKLGSDVIYVSKWSWVFTPDYPWWRFVNRPNPDLEDLAALEEHSEYWDGIAFVGGRGVSVSYKGNEMTRANANGVSRDYDKVTNLDFEEGRYFSYSELNLGKNVTIIGGKIAQVLFPNGNALGKNIKMAGKRVTVIGVLKYQGEGSFGVSINNDRDVIIPVNYARRYYAVRRLGGNIVINPRDDIDAKEIQDHIRGVMRAHRKIKPLEEEDFSLNTVSAIQGQISGIFTVMHTVGLVIGMFSILVGGFSIANTMFVSVKERTAIIGIQKSLGAKNYFILFQFIFESVLLCLVGGLAGLILIGLLTLLSTYAFDFEIILSWSNISMGLGISAVIGLVSGVSP